MTKFFTKDHEWAEILEDDVVLVGITSYAVEQIGDVTLVELSPVGTNVNIHDHFGDIESVKAVSELFAPVSGEIIEVNEELDMRPELVNDSPLVDGWMIKIKMSNPNELNDLMSEEEYLKYTETL